MNMTYIGLAPAAAAAAMKEITTALDLRTRLFKSSSLNLSACHNVRTR
jgi:hypothetical protein